jgi:hypothetical protein
MAQSGRSDPFSECLLIELKRTSVGQSKMSADPKRTLAGRHERDLSKHICQVVQSKFQPGICAIIDPRFGKQWSVQ